MRLSSSESTSGLIFCVLPLLTFLSKRRNSLPKAHAGSNPSMPLCSRAVSAGCKAGFGRHNVDNLLLRKPQNSQTDHNDDDNGMPAPSPATQMLCLRVTLRIKTLNHSQFTIPSSLDKGRDANPITLEICLEKQRAFQDARGRGGLGTASSPAACRTAGPFIRMSSSLRKYREGW